jgi:uncharacterized membrane protein YqjE
MTHRPTDGIVRSARRMLVIVVSMVKTRLGLLAVEARQELSRVWLLLVLTALALIFVAMSLLMLSLLVIIAYWETSRLLAVGCLLGLYVAATIATLLILRHRAQNRSRLFAASFGELSKDQAALEDAFDGQRDEGFDVEARRRRG